MKKISFLSFFLFAALSVGSQNIDLQKENSNMSTFVELQTSYGKIVLLLYDDTPLHRDNFIKLVNDKVYDGLLFHRVIEGFMIQGGDPDSKNAKAGQMLGEGDLGYTIPAEFRENHINKRGALCAARQGDDVNPKKESSASQFYIVQGRTWNDDDMNMMERRFGKHYTAEQRKIYAEEGGAPHLDGDYTVYGEVVEGMDVVDRIAAAKRDRFDRPLEDIKIISAKVIKK
ncbi:MAG: peptidylprolyl isomerase [Bacteroidales bacterium]|nr:peptidylprolyl isomerase [Bacteroidales bacterium]